MAQSATIYALQVELSDVDRGVYETLNLRLARQPSETEEYLLTRVLAYCLEYTEGIELTEGVAAGDQPAILVRDLTGKVTAWIEVGKPDPGRLHRGMKLAGRAALYTQWDPPAVWQRLRGERIHRAEEIPVYELGREFVRVPAHRATLGLSRSEGELYLDVDGESFSTTILEHQVP
jgi:uncharacterized protein YaeQ